MIALWTLVVAAQAACPSLPAELDAAETALQVLDLPAAEAYLDNAEAALACGRLPDASEVARFHFLDGAVAQFMGDAPAAKQSYRAALALDPEAGLAGFESALSSVVDEARAETPSQTGSIEVSPALADPWQVRVDLGASTPTPVAVMEGLHLVQFTDADGAVFGGHVVLVTADMPVVVNHDLPATPPEPERVRNPVDTSFTVRLGIGTGFAFGKSQTATVDGTTFDEPAFKATTPASLGLDFGVGPVFFEAEGEVGALLDGHYLVEGTPSPEATKLAWGVGLNAGANLGDLALGVGGGAALPGRYRGYALARFTPFRRAPVSLTARAGVRSAHRLGAEPMFGLTVAYDLGLL
ncbi:MAG: hypothetical protein EP330_05010 [Deltaproteobacteria bacterium]|nr:MAG: hypothetical protein EP330_05010 [Deltaproteobacteria bacterium]